MNLRKYGLTTSEENVLRMIQNLYGKRHHLPKECFVNETGENLIAVKKPDGYTLFVVNLSLLAKMNDIFADRFSRKYLLPNDTDTLHLLSGCNADEEYDQFIQEQLGNPPPSKKRAA